MGVHVLQHKQLNTAPCSKNIIKECYSRNAFPSGLQDSIILDKGQSLFWWRFWSPLQRSMISAGSLKFPGDLAHFHCVHIFCTPGGRSWSLLQDHNLSYDLKLEEQKNNILLQLRVRDFRAGRIHFIFLRSCEGPISYLCLQLVLTKSKPK